MRLSLDQLLLHATQPADELHVFETREVGVHLRLFRHISELCAIRREIVVDVRSGEEYFSFGRLNHANHHLYGRGFS